MAVRKTTKILSRRAVLGGALALTASGFPMINRGYYRLNARTPRAYSKRALDLMKSSTVIDMLSSFKLDPSDGFFSRPLSQKDEREFRSSGINCLHFASGVGGPDAFEGALTFLARQQNFAGRHSQVFALVDKAVDILRAKRDGQIAVIMGLQNSEHFRHASDVKFFYDLGQRVSQLTYNSQNRIGSGSTDRADGGVSDFGQAIIAAMNDAGMLVDLSHCGDRTTLDGISLSQTPVSITHSNCRALNDHPRTKTDEAIKACAAKGGVMGITGVRMFVSGREPTSLGDMVDHIDHVVKLVGIDHVGIGSDIDMNGYDDMSPAALAQARASYKASYAIREKADIEGFDHPLKMFDLTEELLRRKYSDANITAILGGNFLRLLTTVWGG
ncbi:dipeptidase [Sphingosinicella rhizophila]|uniref:Membrane dipeptidase n=1 Tax=Sphingosinicella rhizophila TaxID=3050082 RepID=A0ABU3Q6I5_9SPHN|nr:membrane dipeptidase [Sphingosinicella sp. GR2756]MDT9598699.1 membrane dipeptidase [Sphingosinicella sp. GR2756]